MGAGSGFEADYEGREDALEGREAFVGGALLNTTGL